MIIHCDNCNKEFNKRPCLVQEHKNHFCCKQCKDEWLTKDTIEEIKIIYKEDLIIIGNKIQIKCYECETPFLLHPSKFRNSLKNKANIFCSKKCRQKHDSTEYTGKGNPNYQTGMVQLICNCCNKSYEVLNYRKDKSNFCSRACHNQWVKDHPEYTINLLLNQKRSDTKPERIVRQYLETNQIKYHAQHPLLNKFVVDYYLYEYNLVLEVFGDYFHANPLFYNSEKDNLSPKQRQKRGLDRTKEIILKKNGYNFAYIWEYDIYHNLEKTMSNILYPVTTKFHNGNIMDTPTTLT